MKMKKFVMSFSVALAATTVITGCSADSNGQSATTTTTVVETVPLENVKGSDEGDVAVDSTREPKNEGDAATESTTEPSEKVEAETENFLEPSNIHITLSSVQEVKKVISVKLSRKVESKRIILES